jgi:hypothetical protein
MTRRLKTLVSLGLPGLLLAGAVSLERTSPPASVGAGQGPPDLEAHRGARLDKDRRFLLWENAAKIHVAREVIRGRLGLLEGAAALRALDGYRPARLGPLYRDGQSGRSEEECYCRTLLGWARGVGPGRGTDAARVAELEAELRERLKRPGPLRLPDVALDGCLPPDLLPPPDGDRDPAQ